MTDHTHIPHHAEIDALLREDRHFEPPPAFAAAANVRDPAVYDEAERDPEGFWARFARELEWQRPLTRVLEWDPPNARWFVDGQLNACVNCVDRHVRGARRNKAALIWEGEPGDQRTLTYFDLYRQVSAVRQRAEIVWHPQGRPRRHLPAAHPRARHRHARVRAHRRRAQRGLRRLQRRVAARSHQRREGPSARHGRWRLPARAGRAAEARRGRGARATRRQSSTSSSCSAGTSPFVEECIEGRDHWYHDADAARLVRVRARDRWTPRTCSTSSTRRARPGSRRASCTRPADTSWARTRRPSGCSTSKDDDVYWCTADIGWVTGHSYVVYGPLANGATVVMYEGAPDFPHKDRFWEIVEKLRRDDLLHGADRDSRVHAVGPRVAAEARSVDACACSARSASRSTPKPGSGITCTSAATAARSSIPGGRPRRAQIMITPLPGITSTKPGSATRAFPGISAEILNDARRDRGGRRRPAGAHAALARHAARHLRRHGALRAPGTWSRWRPDIYFTGDGAKRDEDGYFWLLGRVDDVLNVAGHRIGTMEVESALVDHASVAEAAVVGRTHDIKGQAVAAFVTLREGTKASPELSEELRRHVAKKIGAIAKPDDVIFAADLPKTRSGKIMRRLLRDIAEGTRARRHDDAGGSGRRGAAEVEVRGGFSVDGVLAKG